MKDFFLDFPKKGYAIAILILTALITSGLGCLFKNKLTIDEMWLLGCLTFIPSWLFMIYELKG